MNELWWGVGGLLAVAAALWLIDYTDTWDRIADRAARRRAAARRGRGRNRVRLLELGSVDVMTRVLADAHVALFDGGSGNADTGQRVTDWQPYDVHGSTVIVAPSALLDPWVEIRAWEPDEPQPTIRFSVPPVAAGQPVPVPRPADWGWLP